MRLSKLRIENFRCLEDVTIEFDALTVLIGANGSGKSTVLRALEWFFEGGALQAEDVWRHLERSVTVTASFIDLNDADKEALGSYADSEPLTLWRSWTSGEAKDKLSGRGLAYAPFEAVRAEDGARAKSAAYSALRTLDPALDLPTARSADAALAAMKEWEEAHPEQLTRSTHSASHLFGAVGGPKLNGRFDYVLVSATDDAKEQTGSGRGTLLARLLDRGARGTTLSERLEDVARAASEEVERVTEEEHGPAIEQTKVQLTTALRRYVQDVSVGLEAQPAVVRLTPPSFDLRIADGGLETDVSRQGHGLQRALLLAMLQTLARSETEVGSAPAVLLAIEEPELYQHPVQARHFASVLSSLAERGEAAFQVAYATHSAYFVDPRRYDRLRRFSRRRADGAREMSTARIERVAARLEGIVAREEIETRIGIALERTLSEAVFADVALVVEGRSDRALLEGLADRDGGLAGDGVAVVDAHGKGNLPLAWAILEELGVPSFLVFDADRDFEEAMHARGRSESEIEAQRTNTVRRNRQLLSLLAVEPCDFPDDCVHGRHAVFATDVEAIWPAAIERATKLARASGDFRLKPADYYREAARADDIEPPDLLRDLLARVRALR